MFGALLRGLIAGAALAAGMAGAFAQANYPSKPIKMILPATPGSATDTIGRFLADRIAKPLGATFVFENRAGAFGSVASLEVSRAAPDGYTFGIGANSTHAANVHLFKDVTYDNFRDFTPIVRVTRNPTLLVVRADLPAKDVKEFIAYAKANPGKLTFGAGNSAGLANGHLLMTMTGISAVQANYKSPPEALVDLLGGRIDFMFFDPFLVKDHIASGKLRGLGVTSTTRMKDLPDYPAIAETLPGYELIGWTAVFGPPNIPADIVAKVHKAMNDVIVSADGDAYLRKLGMEPYPSTPAELGNFVKEQTQKWGDILTKAGVQKQ